MTDGILLLGGAGFIGRALARRLSAEGCHIHVLSRRPADNDWAGVEYHRGSLDDAALLRSILPECHTVIHLACTTTPTASACQPMLEALQNLTPTLRLLELLNMQPKRLIFLSSGGTVYGDPGPESVAEDLATMPRSYYGAGKVALESFLNAFAVEAAVPTVIVRPSNAFGPGQELRRGFGIIRTLLEHARRCTTLSIWGDGSIVRDFIFIDDVVEAICRLIDHPAPGRTYNLGAGIGTSLNELIALVERVSLRKLKVEYMPARRIDVQRIILRTARLEADCGWRPQISLEEGIRRTWRWLNMQGE